MSDKKQKLHYVRSGASRPVQAAIIIETTPNGVRYTDPPGSFRASALYGLVSLVCLCVAAWSVKYFSYHHAAMGDIVGSLFFIAGFSWLAYSCAQIAYVFGTKPTIIEINDTTVRFRQPGLDEHSWPRSKVSIGYNDFRDPVRRWFNCVTIRTETQRYPFLQSRPADEIEWMVEQLRGELKKKPRDNDLLMKLASALPPTENSLCRSLPFSRS